MVNISAEEIVNAQGSRGQEIRKHRLCVQGLCVFDGVCCRRYYLKIEHLKAPVLFRGQKVCGREFENRAAGNSHLWPPVLLQSDIGRGSEHLQSVSEGLTGLSSEVVTRSKGTRPLCMAWPSHSMAAGSGQESPSAAPTSAVFQETRQGVL